MRVSLRGLCSSLARSAAVAVVAAPLAGCFSVPGPAAPAGFFLDIGGDYREDMVTRWVCKEWGSVVLADYGGAYLLHLENLDWVMWPPSSTTDEAAMFGFGTSMASITLSYADPVKPEIITTETKLGAGVTVFAASKKPGGPLLVRMGGDPPVDDTCTVVEQGGAS